MHNFISSSGSGTVPVINYGSGSDFLTSYGSGSGSTGQKVTVPTVPVPQRFVPARHMAEGRGLQQSGAQVEGGPAQLAHRLHLHHFYLIAAHCA